MSEIFTPKPFAEIVADAIERVRLSSDRVTDFNVGSVVRALLEACAVELDDYYQEVYLGLLKAIPTAIYTGFDFDRQPGATASGIVRITRELNYSGAVTFGAGTRFVSSSGVAFVSAEEAVLAADAESVDLIVIATEIGAVGNLAAGALGFEATRTGLSATNPQPTSGGTDGETDEQRAERFALFVLSLARGTVAALRYATTLAAITNDEGEVIERVRRVSVSEVPGQATVWIYNGSTGASSDLLTSVARYIEGYEADDGTLVSGYRSAGVEVEVKPMQVRALDIALEADLGNGYQAAAVESALSLALSARLDRVESGGSIRAIDLVNTAFSVDGVSNVVLLSPTARIEVARSEALQLGELTVTWRA